MKTILIILGALCSAISYTQTFHVHTSLDSVLLGNAVQISYVAENLDCDIEVNIPDVLIYQGPSRTSNVSIVNGNRSFRIVETYVVTPLEIGSIVIPSATCAVEDSLYLVDEEVMLVLDNPRSEVQVDQKPLAPTMLKPQLDTRTRSRSRRQLKKI